MHVRAGLPRHRRRQALLLTSLPPAALPPCPLPLPPTLPPTLLLMLLLTLLLMIPGRTLYSASKFAREGLADSLRNELGSLGALSPSLIKPCHSPIWQILPSVAWCGWMSGSGTHLSRPPHVAGQRNHHGCW